MVLLARAAAAGSDPDWHIPRAPESAGEPTHPAYVRLKDALARYESTGDWTAVGAGPVLRPGDRDARVVGLRDRLRATGEFTAEVGADPWYFDAALYRSLLVFQERHGLAPSGSLNEATRAAANVSAAARIQQLKVTLERWRWLPRNLGPRYVWVNVPGATLQLVDGETPLLEMRVIAGHPSRPTPSFRSLITAVTLNPPWHVPRTIAVEDLLPAERADRGFLVRLGIRVFDAGGRERDPAQIDWATVSTERFPYQLRQDPGPNNSLGGYKFEMASPYDIYLHDTPSRRLFELNSRTLSSGCVRLEKPAELAEALLGDPAKAGTASTATATRSVPLPHPIPVYLVYLTSWVTPAGVVNFRPDIYGRDAGLR